MSGIAYKYENTVHTYTQTHTHIYKYINIYIQGSIKHSAMYRPPEIVFRPVIKWSESNIGEKESQYWNIQLQYNTL